MTEITEKNDGAALPEPLEAFVLQWGDLGNAWGVNRSISQIHAFLYLQERPVTAEEIANVFGMARSNVSNSLKELLAWNLIHRVPIRGDRRDHFEAETDVWEIARRIAAGRKVREIDPAMAALRDCVGRAERDGTVTPTARSRLRAMRDLTEDADHWFRRLHAMPRARLERLARLGARVAAMLPDRRDPG